MAAIDPALLLRAYAAGIFPMADSRDAREVYWVEPAMRGILPLNGFHLSRSLRKKIVSDRFSVTADRAFPTVIAACAEARANAEGTWINAQIEEACNELFALGHAHSIECWHDDRLVGGLYGVTLGAAFFGESMFSRATDASKVALAHLVARLICGGYRLLDCQFLTDHLASLGAVEVPRQTYVGLLGVAMSAGAGAAAGAAGSPAPDFRALDRLAGVLPPDEGAEARSVPGPISGCVIVQLLGQTS